MPQEKLWTWQKTTAAFHTCTLIQKKAVVLMTLAKDAEVLKEKAAEEKDLGKADLADPVKADALEKNQQESALASQKTAGIFPKARTDPLKELQPINRSHGQTCTLQQKEMEPALTKKAQKQSASSNKYVS